MIKKTLWKNILRDIRSSVSRFVAIFAITALGAGFFIGLKSTGPDMAATVDEYFDETRLMDFRLLSPMGFTGEDIEALEARDDVGEVMATWGMDVLVDVPEGTEAVRINALPRDTGAGNAAYLNRLVLTEGRLPQSADECVADSISADQIGDLITVSDQNKSATLDLLAQKQYRVVGRVQSPLYISFQRGNTNIGNGRVAAFFYLHPDAFDSEAYTEVFLRMAGAAEYSAFSQDYKDIIETGEGTLEDFGDERSQIRYDEVYGEASEKLEDARRELADGEQELADKRAEADEEFAEAEAELAQAEWDLADARRQIAENEQKLADGQTQYDAGVAELASARATLDQKQAEYDAGLAEFTAQKAAFEQTKAEFAVTEQQYLDAVAQLDAADAGVAGYAEGVSQLEGLLDQIQNAPTPEEQQAATEAFTAGASAAADSLWGMAAGMPDAADQLNGAAASAQGALANGDYAAAYGILAAVPGAVQPSLDAARATLDASGAQLQSGREQLALAEEQLAAAEVTLNEGHTALQDGWAQLGAGQAALDAAAAELASGRAQLADARVQVAEGEQELAEGWAEYEEAKAEAEEEFAKAEDDIAEAKREIRKGERDLAELEDPEWYVSTRADYPGYSGFESDTERIDSIAAVVPVFFFLVAALVCLTTMTRMVEEQRTLIGTFKAMGIGKAAIAFKYILYAGVACVSGAAAGVAVGSFVFPLAIWNAYSMMYIIGPLVVAPPVYQVAVNIGASFLITSGATLAACIGELRSVPAVLMRPRAPRPGKRILLERAKPLWKRLKFSWKVTARNLFRYKKRFIMTVIGVAGCTALLLTGFGLRDSITGMVDLQYSEINLFSAVASLIDPATSGEESELNERMAEFGEGLYVSQSNLDAANGARTNAGMSTYLYAFEDTENIADFFDFRDRKTGEKIPFPEGGVIVTEKLAGKLGVGVGDSFEISTVEEEPHTVTVAGVAENYIYNYVFLSAEGYESAFGGEPEYNTLLLRIPEDKQEGDAHEELMRRLLDTDNVMGAMDITDLRGQLDDLLTSLNSVVWVIILAAGALAFVVLYNLTNINITERSREIATLKVLGFFNGEVASYVYRENIVLTLIGAAVGLVMGVFLHQFVIQATEIDEVMFRRTVLPLSYLWSVLFTIASSLFVNVVMLGRLRRVDMVESLKSAE